MDAKERVFKRIDALVDAGIDVSNLRRELPQREYDAVRKQAVRTFGSYEQALREYGIGEPVGKPSETELFGCFEITEQYVVIETPNADYIRELYEIDEMTFRRLTKPHRERTEIDALDEFYREQYPLDHLPTAALRDSYPKLYGYMRKHYGTYRAFLKAYKVSYEYELNRNFGGRKTARYGHAFEQELAKVLIPIYPDVKYHEKIADCIPDFIVNGTQWIDAKLSAWTIYDTRSRTLEKYARHTDNMTVYYALGKRAPFTYKIADVLHVSTLYDALVRVGRRDLIEDMETFISALEPRKEGAA
ncbi:hypothetical protein [Paenibacillus illinoisensis]|uniref:hypothetical protein n=1 Tax=Paenibacillus illinoisensis TaxID=59845 RepID=UPI00203F68C8|nr:hypothetical protein [Paenibacillus illinoisensis]MCM3205682.1 hypothetical protein [Paenibacillus illinoisensis]